MTRLTYPEGDLGAVILHVHDGFGDLDVNGLHDGLDVERSLEPLRHQQHGICHNNQRGGRGGAGGVSFIWSKTPIPGLVFRVGVYFWC